ncbi:MAG: TetR/AcrR family transcriptional regulator [Actinobacteria bacterium HGW-Actinobacteria-6]|jgi:AcrR family transcriptional regulator|nr:MAG: TetR/AcrR family transcriptional regulator [Actinobacteria bacterium HGW-Actinobacteria-6]
MSDKAATTRQRLLDAAAAVFSERGYARATTKEIAKSAGVAEGTIYRHFDDKRELFKAAFAERTALMRADTLDRLPELAGQNTVRENLRRLVLALEEAEAAIAPLQAAMSSDMQLLEALALPVEGGAGGVPTTPLVPLAAYLAAEQELGRVKAGIDPERAAFALFAIPFTAVTSARMMRGVTITQSADIMGALDVVLGGLEP